MPEFTKQELEDIANMVCGRYDALMDMASNFNGSDNDRKKIRKTAEKLSSLNVKLRPYFTGKDS